MTLNASRKHGRQVRRRLIPAKAKPIPIFDQFTGGGLLTRTTSVSLVIGKHTPVWYRTKQKEP
jgi:hypothetical protein